MLISQKQRCTGLPHFFFLFDMVKLVHIHNLKDKQNETALSILCGKDTFVYSLLDMENPFLSSLCCQVLLTSIKVSVKNINCAIIII